MEEASLSAQPTPYGLAIYFRPGTPLSRMLRVVQSDILARARADGFDRVTDIRYARQIYSALPELEHHYFEGLAWP